MKKFYPLVSCVIPIYNAEDYLDQGIRSLLAQTYDNLEIILVDDHSTDESWNVCQKYVKDYPNVYAYKTKQNSGGPLRGREKGIHEANGEWITFMDCDDYVKPSYIENLVKTTQGGKYDIAVTGHSRLYPDGKIEDFLWDDYSQTSQQRLETFYKHYFVDQNFWTDPTDTVGQNLIRASVAKSTDLSKYSSKIWAEDTLMALAFLENSKNGVNFVDHHDFLWRQREGSGSHGGFLMTANRSEFYEACNDIFTRKKLFPIVSIIVPIYKVEEYVVECIDSLLTQTYSNLEIILVDDKSPDRSGEMADVYAKKDSRIKVIHKAENQGLNMARATGFKHSTGDLIMFVDSDDLLTRDCISKAVYLQQKHHSDFVRFGMRNYTGVPDSTVAKDQITGAADAKEELIQGRSDLFRANLGKGTITVWGALYSRTSVLNINWREMNFRVFEDNFWSLYFLKNVKKGVYTSELGYLYRTSVGREEAVLSKKITGNELNGRPVGYFEFASLLMEAYREYDRHYRLNCEDAIKLVEDWHWNHRLEQITQIDDWQPEEGDKRYVIKALQWAYRKKITLEKEASVQNSKIANLEKELKINQAEISNFLNLKRSIRLVLGNMKRRLKGTRK